MSKKSNQKLKALYIMKLLLEKSDENNMLTLAEIKDYLEKEGINAERKSLYDDMEALRDFGLDIEKSGSRGCGYYIANRTFELPELRLLVDAVQSSKFITSKKSTELIKKVEKLTSTNLAKDLHRQVYVTNRVKSMNESIYYNVDKIHNAIAKDKKITFRYFEWIINFSSSEKIKKNYRKSGDYYRVSPWHLTWDNENYYMIAFDSETETIKHYRVDKMEQLEITEEQRDGKDSFAQFDIATYTGKLFGMFSGLAQKIKIRFHNQLIGVVIDRFGKDVFITKDDDSHFLLTADVVVSPQFCGWLTSFGNLAKVIFPPEVVETYKNHLTAAGKQYDETE